RAAVDAAGAGDWPRVVVEREHDLAPVHSPAVLPAPIRESAVRRLPQPAARDSAIALARSASRAPCGRPGAGACLERTGARNGSRGGAVDRDSRLVADVSRIGLPAWIRPLAGPVPPA